jgi:hypothetical protein
MSTVDEIKSAIAALPEPAYTELRKWFAHKDGDLWDQQIESDSYSGKLDFLIDEALEEKRQGKLKPL